MLSRPGHLDERWTRKEAPPIPLEKEVFTSRKHGMDYFTVDGVILRTGYKNKLDWYLLPIREILDNDADFLWKYYKGSENATISVSVMMDDELFRIVISNSNDKNIPVFSDLKSIFDYDMRYGSKQDVHIISRGMLGDAMKQILSLGYVLLHAGDDGTAFTDKQWEYPLIIRHNNTERKIFLRVDKARQTWDVSFEDSSKDVKNSDTEFELVLPVIEEVRDKLDRKYIEKFWKKYSILTTDISFKFSIIDDITHTYSEENDNSGINLPSELNKTLSMIPEKGIVNIDIPAIHPIATEKQWSNSDSVWSYKPEEFIRRIENVHEKSSISVHDVVLTFNREGSNFKKYTDYLVPVDEFLSKPNKDQRIEQLFYQLRNVLDAPVELSLPFTTITKNRSNALVTRIAKLYDIDREQKPSYRLIRGLYRDGVVRYPFAFEIIAIPLKNPFVPPIKSTEIITAVNYSVSPIDNIFEGDYEWQDKNGRYHWAKNIRELIEKHGFHSYYGSKSRLPSVIVTNLITPRRDPQGYDKSSIDTQPFISIIATAVDKMASGIKTNRAAGYRFQKEDDYSTARRHDINTKVSAKNLLREFLKEERGLPM